MVCSTWSLYGLSLEFFLLWHQSQENCANFEASPSPSCKCCNYPYCHWLVILVPVYLVFLQHKGRNFQKEVVILGVVRQEQIYLFRDGAMATIRIKPRCKAFVFYLSDLHISFFLICFRASFVLTHSFYFFHFCSRPWQLMFVIIVMARLWIRWDKFHVFLPSFHRNQVREGMSNRPVPIPGESI